MLQAINEDCYVSFIDILGFKDIVLKEKSLNIREIFERITSLRDTLLMEERKLYSDFSHMIDNMVFRIMSDSIIIAIPSKHKNSLAYLCYCCLKIQQDLLSLGVLVRGGISRGDFFCENEITFGEGLVKAYMLETYAENPRIIVNPGLVQEYLALVKTSTVIYVTDFLELADDMYYYIDFWGGFESDYNKLRNLILDGMFNEKNSPTIRNKYIWLAKQFNCFLKSNEELDKKAIRKLYIDLRPKI